MTNSNVLNVNVQNNKKLIKNQVRLFKIPELVKNVNIMKIFLQKPHVINVNVQDSLSIKKMKIEIVLNVDLIISVQEDIVNNVI